MLWLLRIFSPLVLLVSFITLTWFATATPQQDILIDMSPESNHNFQTKPTLAHFPIEDLSPEEWQAEHQRLRAELGDEAYLSLRKSEIKDKMESIVALIISGQWELPLVDGSQEPDRIIIANGRQFRVGVVQGVPEEITEAMWATFDDGVEIQEVPEEWLEYEVSQEELEAEERQDDEARKQRDENEDLKILEGRLSVRDIGMGCLKPAKEEPEMDESF